MRVKARSFTLFLLFSLSENTTISPPVEIYLSFKNAVVFPPTKVSKASLDQAGFGCLFILTKFDYLRKNWTWVWSAERDGSEI
ncbi:hypothetical protein IMY05_009G0100300 [Salix suchowensis]|nr:hypothetical protein IMY05_009G0100300 [Salix suchowensis]